MIHIPTYLFLDFDGPINTGRCDYYEPETYERFDSIAVANLGHIIRETGAKIVVSSSWHYLGLAEFKKLWTELKMPGEIVGCTSGDGEVESRVFNSRGDEIETWLRENGGDIYKYVIIDDMPDSEATESQKSRWIQINPRTGISEADAERVIKMLKVNVPADAISHSHKFCGWLSAKVCRFFTIAAVVVLVLSGCNGMSQSMRYYGQKNSFPAMYDTEKEVQLFHYWRDIPEDQYLFEVPVQGQVEVWKKLCEEENPPVLRKWSVVYSDYKSINHIVTVDDLIETYWSPEIRENRDSFFMWRLEQFDVKKHRVTSERERFKILEQRIDDVCNYEFVSQYDLNWMFGLQGALNELLIRKMCAEVIRCASPDLACALVKENDAWEAYHAQHDSSYTILTQLADDMYYSSRSMELCQVSGFDVNLRQMSLSDFFFALADGKDPDNPERHILVTEQRVLDQYMAFKNSLVDDEDYIPVSQRRQALDFERDRWDAWMQSREAVSGLLVGNLKSIYDNASNNVRRCKYIDLLNRYQHYGVMSNEVASCLVPYAIPDDVLFEARSFDKNWKKLLEEIGKGSSAYH